MAADDYRADAENDFRDIPPAEAPAGNVFLEGLFLSKQEEDVGQEHAGEDGAFPPL